MHDEEPYAWFFDEAPEEENEAGQTNPLVGACVSMGVILLVSALLLAACLAV